MDLKVNRGGTIRLPAEFLSGGRPTDPTETTVNILDPSGATVESGMKPVREQLGIYHLDYPVSRDAALGTWRVVWEAVVNGKQVSGDDPFDVLPGEPVDPPAPAAVSQPPVRGGGPGVGPSSTSPPAAGAATPSAPSPSPTAPPGKAPASPAPPAGAPVPTPPASAAPRPAAPPPAAPAGRVPDSTAPRRPAPPAPGSPPDSAPKLQQPAPAPRPASPDPPKVSAPAPPSSRRRGKKGKPTKRPAPAPGRSAAPPPDTPKDPSVFVFTAPKSAGDQAEEELEREEAVTRRFRRRRLKVALGLLGIIALGFALFLTFQLDQEASYEAAFAQAEGAIAEGNLEGARTVYRDILQQDPANKFAHFNLGMLAHMEGRGAEAEDFYRRALRSDPTFLAPLFNLAILQEALGRDEEAAQTYRQILEDYPDDAASRFNYGSLLIRKLGDEEEGQRQIDRAVELDSSLSDRVSPVPPEPGEPVASPQSEE